MESTLNHSRRHHSTPTPPSPRLVRSRSGTPAISLPESRACNSLNTSQRFANSRSKSTTRSRIQHKNEEYVSPSSVIASMQKKPAKESGGSNKDGFARFWQQGSPRNNSSATKKTKPVTSSPSAWALSPARSSPFFVAAESPGSGPRKVKSSSSGGGVSGVLKYFKQKKVSPVQEEEYHRFRILQNTLVQYRFANARAEATIASLKKTTEEKLFGGWLRVLKMRNFILEKYIEVQKLKHEIKLCHILNPQIRLLNEWAKLEGKNFEAVGRVTRKLSAISVKLPFDDAIKADIESVYNAMNMASAVMDGIEATAIKFLPQAEKILYMVTELITTLEHEEEYLKDLNIIVPPIPALLDEEKYLRVHLLQAADDSKEKLSSPRNRIC